MFDRSSSTQERPGLITLIRQIPTLISRLIRDEISAARAELTAKLKESAVGIGLTVAGVVVGLFAIGVILATAILGLSTALPPWLAALLVGVVLIIGTVVLLLLGISRLKKSLPPVPSESIDSVKADIAVVKGNKRRARG
jgi:hypothetical protein